MLKLKLQHFGHMMRKANSLEKILGKIEDKRRTGRQRMKWLDGIINSMDMSVNTFWEMVKGREAWRAAFHEFVKSRNQGDSWPKFSIPVTWYKSILSFQILMVCIKSKTLKCCGVLCRSVMSNSLQPVDCSLPGSSVHGDSPGKNIGVDCHFLLQGIFLTQR